MSVKIFIVFNSDMAMPASKFEELGLDADQYTAHTEFFGFDGTIYQHNSIPIAIEDWCQDLHPSIADTQAFIDEMENRDVVPVWDGNNLSFTLTIPDALSEGFIDVINKSGGTATVVTA